MPSAREINKKGVATHWIATPQMTVKNRCRRN